MTTRYTWIKLYTEILDDPKMARMDDGLWRFTVELFLIAGKGGTPDLPSIADIAWLLRRDESYVTQKLETLTALGILTAGGSVKNFEKRQAAMSLKERKQRNRAGQSVSRFRDTNVTEEEVEEEVEEEEKKKQKAAEKTAPAPAAETYETNRARASWNDNASRDANALLCQAAALPALPGGELNRLEPVAAMMVRYGKDATSAALVSAKNAWVATPRKSGGGNYSVLNMGWVDWAMEYLATGKPPWVHAPKKTARPAEMRGEAVNAEVAKWLGRR